MWEKQDSPGTVLSSVYNDGTSTLTLSDIQRDQAGSYRCKANNGIPTSNSDVFSASVIVKVHCKYMHVSHVYCLSIKVNLFLFKLTAIGSSCCVLPCNVLDDTSFIVIYRK